MTCRESQCILASRVTSQRPRLEGTIDIMPILQMRKPSSRTPSQGINNAMFQRDKSMIGWRISRKGSDSWGSSIVREGSLEEMTI